VGYLMKEQLSFPREISGLRKHFLESSHFNNTEISRGSLRWLNVSMGLTPEQSKEG